MKKWEACKRILIHTEGKWLSQGRSISRFYEPKDEVLSQRKLRGR